VLLAAGFSTLIVFLPAPASARSTDTSVTYTATQTIPLPPASNYAGSGGGDGWAVALTPQAVYNVFHHNSILQVACHLQTDASVCWPGATRTITDLNGNNFSSSGEPGLWLDQATGHLYVFAARTSDATGGVVCIDTVAAPTTVDPFCGFTPLTAIGGAPVNSYSDISDPAVVGNRWFAFNYVNGVGNETGTENTLMCFDLTTFAACGGQPFTVNIGSGAVSAGTPGPSIAAIGRDVIIPIHVGETDELACFDGIALADCAAPSSWPVVIAGGYVGSNGPPFPLLTASGGITGFCLPTSGDPCYDLTGAAVDTPPGMASAIQPSVVWNGPGFVLGPRVYVPRWSNVVGCYDYSLSQSCTNFPKSLNSLGLLYTVNADPQRPTCIWVNADNGGSQIQNFDAFTGGPCGEGPIRVLASSSVVDTPLCTPGSWTSLQVTSPAPSTYSSGSVAFQDADGNPIPGVPEAQIDNTGTVSLSGLALSNSLGLPQFLITLNGEQGTPGAVVVKLTWTGTFDPSCLTKPGTTVPNPPASGGAGAPPVGASAPPVADVKVSMTTPQVARVGTPLKFTTTVKDNGPDTATGVILRAPVPVGATLASVSSTVGICAGGTTATCYIGTLASGASATVTMTFTTANVGPLTLTPSAEADYDPNLANNTAPTTVNVISQTAPPPAPPASSQPGTFNAIGTGTVIVNGVVQPNDQIFQLNSGDVVDVTNGTITFTGSDGQFLTVSGQVITAARVKASLGSAAAGTVVAQFILAEPAVAGSLTTLTLTGGDFSSCASPRVISKDKTPIRQLWTSGKGNFSTKAKYAAATVRGTVWQTEDRCDGTFVSVVTDSVQVLDIPLNKTVVVSAGQTYLAQPPRAPFKPPALTPAQTPAQVKLRGLIWGGHTYKTRSAFVRYLTSIDRTWQDFATAYPKLAAALNSRKAHR
jgi:uncharacterized repeat protein (TIGR01451 family)